MTQTPNISGFQMASVARVLAETRRTGIVPPGSKLAIIFEGGAMRALLSCQYGRAIEHCIQSSAFKIAIGSSAGAINAVYFVSGDLNLGPEIYTIHATDRRCTNVWNFPDVLNVDWLIDTCIFGAKKFNLQKFRSSDCAVRIVLTKLFDGTPTYFDAIRSSDSELRQAMSATSYAPLVTTKTQHIQGVEFGDGAISDAIPYQEAIRLGATHIVCLLTRPPNYRKRFSKVAQAVQALRLHSHTQKYRAAYFHRAATYNHTLDQIYNGVDARVPVMVIHPRDDSEMPSSIETRPQVLEGIGKRAYLSSLQQLELLLGT